MYKKNFIRGVTAAAGYALVSMSGTAVANDKIVLKLAEPLPTSNLLSVQGSQFFMKRVGELTNGRVQFQHFPAGQLGAPKDMLKLTETGVADIGYIAASYDTSKFPLSSVAELPTLYASACEGTRKYSSLMRGNILDKAEYEPKNILPLVAYITGPLQVAVRNKELKSFDDLAGLKIRGSGGSLDRVLRDLGASPLNFPVSEVRQSLQLGTVDGTTTLPFSLKPYDLTSVIQSMSQGASLGSFATTYSINLRKFKSLPEPVRAALVQAGKETEEHLCKSIEASDTTATAEAEKAGVKFWKPPAEELAKVENKLRPVLDAWAKGLDERRLPGSEVLKAFKAAK